VAWRAGSGDPDRMDPDTERVSRARRGDVDAFAELVRAYQDRMVNYAAALVGDAADAEDIVQEAFIRAFRSIRRFRGDSLFRTWLYQIVTNAARTHRSRRRLRPEDTTGAPSNDDREGPPPLRDPGDLEAQIVLRDRLDRALSALPDDLREAVVLRDVEGFDYREIATMLGIPMGTVESRIFRARERLRALLTASAAGATR